MYRDHGHRDTPLLFHGAFDGAGENLDAPIAIALSGPFENQGAGKVPQFDFSLNLDGGGSTTMVVEGLGEVNQPSGGVERAVSNHLGIFADGTGAPGSCEMWMDEAIVGPVLAALQRHGPFRVLVAPDHPTPVATKAHSGVPPPFCYAGHGVTEHSGRRFTEQDAVQGGDLVQAGHTLIDQFLGR